MISISGNITWARSKEDRQDGKKIEVFIFLFLFVNSFFFVQCFTIIIIKCKASFSCHFVNSFVFLFVQCFTIIIIKCKASFSCHSSSSHYSTQGFILISSHFIFSFLKNKKNKILCNFTCDLLLCLRISDLKCGQAKNSQANGSLGENISVFFNHTFLL